VDQVTQRNAATAEESSAASEELTAQAESMRDGVGRLVELINGIRENQNKHWPAPRPGQMNGMFASSPKPNVGGKKEFHSNGNGHHAESWGNGSNGSGGNGNGKRSVPSSTVSDINTENEDDFKDF
jgi:hypothetical protein